MLEIRLHRPVDVVSARTETLSIIAEDALGPEAGTKN